MASAVLTPLGNHDPLASLAGTLRRDGGWLVGCVLLAAVIHGVGMLAIPHGPGHSSRTPDAPLEVIELEPPTPPPVSQVVPAPIEAAPSAALPKPVAAPPTEARPQAAQAGQVLTRTEAASDPLDLTGGFVTGAALDYAGGTTMAAGTSRTVVHANSVVTAAAAPVGKQVGVLTGTDPSRRASVVGGSSWQCPFPIEADGIDQATVDLEVDVDASGGVHSASITRDPGRGFGREARRCVLDKKWQPALDRVGSAVASRAAIRVRFIR